MKGFSLTDLLSIIGSLASIIGLAGVTIEDGQRATISRWVMFVGIFLIIGAYLWMRKRHSPIVGRPEVIETGKRIILSTKSQLFMYGGDISWAKDYAKEMKLLIDQAKKVYVICPASEDSKIFEENKEIVRNIGAQMIKTKIDTGLRGMLVDPDDEDRKLFMANRKLKRKFKLIRAGVESQDNLFEYEAFVYDREENKVLTNTFSKITKYILETYNEKS